MNDQTLNKITIIIPTYNRPNHLQRILDYYHQYGSDFNIIVADSSLDENKKLNKKTISSFSNLKIQYLDNYSPQINLYYKFADMVNYAQEKYCLFCPDDSFITPKGIKKSVEFLEKNPDFTVAQGVCMSFDLRYGKRKKQKKFYWTPGSSYESTFPDAKYRLTEHLSNYLRPTLYHVHRTDFARMIFKELLVSKVDPLLFGELLPSMLALIYGKMKHLNVLYMVVQAYSRCGYWPSLRDFIEEGKYDAEYKKFRNCLANHLTKKSQIDIEESQAVVDNAMALYIKNSFPNDFKHLLMYKMRVIWMYLGLSKKVYERVRVLYTRLAGPKYRDDFLNFIEDPSLKYYDDLNKIKDCIISHTW